MNDTQHAPHRGVLVLVLGILAVAQVCPVLGPVAWILGRADLAEIDAGRMDPAGRSLTQAGMICGIIETAIMILTLLGVVLFFGFALLIGASTASS